MFYSASASKLRLMNQGGASQQSRHTVNQHFSSSILNRISTETVRSADAKFEPGFESSLDFLLQLDFR